MTRPVSGVVIDGEPGQLDVDYQSHYTLHASWSDFFDRESGILMYKYGFYHNCIPTAEFLLENSSLVNEYFQYFFHNSGLFNKKCIYDFL